MITLINRAYLALAVARFNLAHARTASGIKRHEAKVQRFKMLVYMLSYGGNPASLASIVNSSKVTIITGDYAELERRAVSMQAKIRLDGSL